MKKFLPKLLLPLIFWAAFIYIVNTFEPPQTFTQISLFQILLFFIPLFLAILFTINLIIRFLLFSLTISLAMCLLILLKGLGGLNPISGLLTLFAFGLLLSYLKQFKRKFQIRTRLTKKIF